MDAPAALTELSTFGSNRQPSNDERLVICVDPESRSAVSRRSRLRIPNGTLPFRVPVRSSRKGMHMPDRMSSRANVHFRTLSTELCFVAQSSTMYSRNTEMRWSAAVGV